MHISPVHDVAWSTTVSSYRRSKLAGSVSGVSLLELLVVVAIIGVLTTYIAPRFLGSVGKSEIQTARVQTEPFRFHFSLIGAASSDVLGFLGKNLLMPSRGAARVRLSVYPGDKYLDIGGLGGVQDKNEC